jgi:AcrR family transcriptional regulator
MRHAMRENRFMSTPADRTTGEDASLQPGGLRERKKAKLRRAIQDASLRLFAAHGYEQTTVEEIAEAAETSTSTFYRYFPSKEDVVLNDEVDDAIEAAFASRPIDESLVESFRAVAGVVIGIADSDQEFHIARLRMMSEIPALRARYASTEFGTVALFGRVLADRTGLSADDYQVELTAAAVTSVIFTAGRRWATERGRTSIDSLIGQAITVVEPLLAALTPSNR